MEERPFSFSAALESLLMSGLQPHSASGRALDLAGRKDAVAAHPSRAFREGWAAIRPHHGISASTPRVFERERIGSISTHPCDERKFLPRSPSKGWGAPAVVLETKL